MTTAHAMATETEFVTAPSTPEPARPTAPGEEPPAAQPDSLEIVMEQRLLQHDGDGGSSSMTIFRVPAHVRDANKELYEPRLVSIGPYYRGREALRAMEQHKWRYLRELLNKEPPPRISLADCARAVRKVEQEARRCYSERTGIFDAAAAQGGPLAGETEDGQSRRGNPPGPEDFGEMLLLDGCFVLQFFIKWHKKEEEQLCDVGWGLPLLQTDLLLLENQIPFFVLEALFGIVAPDAETRYLRDLILPHLRLSQELSTTEMERATQAREIRHLLHLLYEAVVPRDDEMELVSPPRPAPQYVVQLRQMGVRVGKAVSERFNFIRGMPQLPRWMSFSCSMTLLRLREATAWFSKCTARVRREAPSEPAETTFMVVPSVTLLRKAGVRFEKKASPRHMFDITFDATAGVVTMPRLEVDHANKPLLVNLVAFEQTIGSDDRRQGVGKLMSSYTALVSSLVRKGKDVKHLQKRGIVNNLLGSDDDAAAKFFQQLGDCSSLDYEGHMFATLFTDLNLYYHSSWRRHKAKFLHEHCRSPWAMLALVIAGCVFCFALFKFSTTMYGLVHPYCRRC